MGDGERLILRMLPGQRHSINLKETCKMVDKLVHLASRRKRLNSLAQQHTVFQACKE